MYEVSTGIRSIRNEDGGILLDTNQDKIFRLNVMGALIFERLSRRQTKTQIIDEISREFGTSAGIVETDVAEFLESLHRQGLVQGRAEET